MKRMKLMRGIGLLCMALVFGACHHDTITPRLSKAQKQEYGQKLAGTYTGRYVIAYTTDGGGKEATEGIKQATVSITDYDMQSVIFHDFPVSMLSHIVKDANLSQALAEVPNMDITAQYKFQYDTDYTNTLWNYTPTPVSLTLDYGGATHHITFRLGNNQRYYLFHPGDWQQSRPLLFCQWELMFDFVSLYEGDRLVQQFDFGSGTCGMFVVFALDETDDWPDDEG